MPGNLIGKGRQLVSDPVLRRWLAGRLMGKHPGEPACEAHRPPYLDDLLPLAPAPPAPTRAFTGIQAAPPAAAIDLPLPGLNLRLAPGEEDRQFSASFADTETLLALHRFAWLPLLGEGVDVNWVAAMWRAWRAAFGDRPGGWPWHPYTAAERAINILEFGRRHGLPEPLDDTLAVLAAHAPAIAQDLEYFGDHHTSNHLANNGRGLYLLGLELGLEASIEVGARILIEEARRIFMPSGILREGSSHYHLLLTRNYISAWRAARADGRPEEAELRSIVDRALSVIPLLTLPGGMPLIGDISPDFPPDFLGGLASGEVEPAAARDLGRDGWLRADFGPWSGLWHTAPGGWSHMPGHGHQDCGGFELHYDDETVFHDPGRGAYGETGEAALYRSGRAHNTVLVEGADPYPPNKPYYDPGFRGRIGGPAPELRGHGEGVILRHQGFSRLQGVAALTRRWDFSGHRMTVTDNVEGSATRTVSRLFHTPLAVEVEDDGAILMRGNRASYRLRVEGARPVPRSMKRWVAYGESRPATVIEAKERTRLPWTSTATLEAL